ncbi:hypothetical protein G6F54_014311 [Rhizopus delemar]|nr:hypothetical protein G6F54_014311 [Rhizopus delemar]
MEPFAQGTTKCNHSYLTARSTRHVENARRWPCDPAARYPCCLNPLWCKASALPDQLKASSIETSPCRRKTTSGWPTYAVRLTGICDRSS